MRYVLTGDIKLDNLGINLDYWKYKYEAYNPFTKNDYYEQYEKAKKAYSNYYNSKYKKAKVNIVPSEKYTMIADLTEKFEEYEF
jgi:hypothetical protein